MAYIKKILALQRESLVAPGVFSLSVSARITEVLDYLSYFKNIEYVLIAEQDETAFRALNWADVLILSKHCSNRALDLVNYAKNIGVKVIYDIDDWIFAFPKYSGGHTQECRFRISGQIIELTDIVTVANSALMEKIRPIVSNPVFLPNGMWVEKYIDTGAVATTLDSVPPRIVFTNADFLKVRHGKEMLLTALQVFFLHNPDYVLDFYGDPFPEIFFLPFLHYTKRMPYSEYMQALISGKYQFAITPLGGAEDEEDLDFNLCKNPFKYLNYGTARVPGIYSRSAIYEACVIDGNTGILVDNNYESWLDALNRLANDKRLRDSIRSASFNDIMENHHVKKSADVLLGLL